jgi:hypothetical protein
MGSGGQERVMFAGISSDLSGSVKDFPETALPCPSFSYCLCILGYDNRPGAAKGSQEGKGWLFAHWGFWEQWNRETGLCTGCRQPLDVAMEISEAANS